jgi:uncharacterized FAD-dependent dehydrogenase
MSEKSIIGFLMNGISLSPDVDEREACVIASNELKRAGISPARLRFDIYKKSVDARKKNQVRLVYSVAVRAKDGEAILPPKHGKYTTSALYDNHLELTTGTETMSHPPLVVGMGPAGLFCALLLAEQGYCPILIDRGDSVKDRCAAHDRFHRSGILDTESNIQFGAGGAGTFSDGKLLTRINDPKIGYILRRFCEFGAPEEILVSAKPHIGTDLLVGVVDRLLAHIEKLGGEVIYRCKLTDLELMPSGNVMAKTTKGNFECSSLVLALGHSARDTYEMLIRKSFNIIAKPISVGVRIEHKRSFIEEALYGKLAGLESLGAAEYALSDTKGERGVYTFCMCPGGEVVAAASENGGVVVNGMSSYARDGENSNSAIAVSVRPDDFEAVEGNLALGAIAYQRKIERAAFLAGGSDYSVPVQTVGDFMSEKSGREPYLVFPTYMGGGSFKCADMCDVLPPYVCNSLRYGLYSFDKKIKGFSMDGALLSGAETRTSAPVRILRGEDMRAIGMGNIYPCGEGAGYAGGITSAAVDGIKTALAISERFAPLND